MIYLIFFLKLTAFFLSLTQFNRKFYFTTIIGKPVSLARSNSGDKYIILKIKKKNLFIHVPPKIDLGTTSVYHT